jgi:hemolysin activation/secretion protein
VPPLAPEAPPVPVEAGPPVHVVGVEIEGASAYPPAELRQMLHGIEGATVPRGEIADAIREIQTRYRRDGYFLTVVRGTVEPVPGGARLQIRVIEGYISSVKIEGDIGPAETLVYRFLNHLTEFRPVRITDVERYALLAQNISGISLRTVLRAAGTEPGAVELIAEVERKALEGLVSGDNRGPPSAGPNEILVGAAANSFTAAGERTQVLIYDTPFDNHQVYGQASVEGFVGSEGLKLRGYVGYGDSLPGGVLAATGFQSDLLQLGVSATYPVIRTRELSLSLSGAFDIEESIIDLLNTSDGREEPTSKTNLRILRLGESLDVQDDLLGAGRAAGNTVNLTISRGLPELFGQKNGAAFLARPGERNDFTKFTLELIRVQNLLAWDSYSLALKLAFAGQATPDILPPIEKFFLGGEQYGRGFFSGEVTGDNVAAGTVELQLNDTVGVDALGEHLDVGLQYYAFYDVGQTYENAPGDPNQRVESIGVGVRAKLTPRLSMQVEGVDRFTRRPASAVGSLEPQYAAFFHLIARF